MKREPTGEHAHTWTITHTRLKRGIGDRWVVRCDGCPAVMKQELRGRHRTTPPMPVIDTMFLFMERDTP